VTSVVVIFAGSVYPRIEPLPTKEELEKARQLRRAQRLHERPSLKDLPLIEPMKIEQALILGEIGGLFPGKREASKPWQPPDVGSGAVPRMYFRAEYVTEEDARGCQEFNPYSKDGSPFCLYSWSGKEIPVIVEVQQFPNEAWPLYFAKWSPMPHLLQEEDPDLDITRVTKFKNRVVMDRQFRFPDETGKLLFFWPSGKNLISITFTSKVIQEECLRRYLERYPNFFVVGSGAWSR